MTKLFVGNLDWKVTEADLHEAFSEFGTVSKVQIILDHATGRPRGFAFVTLEDGADVAVRAMHGAAFMGRTLTVNEARPRVSRYDGQRE